MICKNVSKGNWQPGQCYLCWLWTNIQAYAVLWGPLGPHDGATIRKPRGECHYLGSVLPNQAVACVHKIRKCDEFGFCTIQPTANIEHNCITCERWEEK